MNRAGFRRAACRRTAGGHSSDKRAMPARHPNPVDGPVLTSRDQGMTLLDYIRRSGVCAELQLRLDAHPGPASKVTAEIMLLALLLAARILRSSRRTDMSLLLAGLDHDVAAQVGLLDADGTVQPPAYDSLCRQMVRLQDILRDGWVSSDGRSLRGMHWLQKEMLKASIPRRVRRKIRHLAVDATSVRSWGTWLSGQSPRTAGADPHAGWLKDILDGTANEDDLKELQRNLPRRDGPQYGPDNRRIYGTDPDARIGYKSQNSEGPAGFFMGYDLHLAVACPTVTFNGDLNKATLRLMTPWICAMSYQSAGTNPGPVGADLVLDYRDIFPNVTEVTADRGYSTKRETFLRPLHRNNINVTMDYRQDVVNQQPKPVTLGKRETVALMHAGTLLSAQTPKPLLELPPPRKRDGHTAKWYEERAEWRWSVKARLPEGSIQFRSPANAARTATTEATEADGSYTVPFTGADIDDPATVTARVEELDLWQSLPYGTGVWRQTYATARNAVEGRNSKVKQNLGLARGTTQAMGREANTLAALAQIVVHNLRLAATEDQPDDTPEDHGQRRSQIAPAGGMNRPGFLGGSVYWFPTVCWSGLRAA